MVDVIQLDRVLDKVSVRFQAGDVFLQHKWDASTARDEHVSPTARLFKKTDSTSSLLTYVGVLMPSSSFASVGSCDGSAVVVKHDQSEISLTSWTA